MKLKWTFEKVKEAALKCKSRTEFGKKYGRAYNIARMDGFLDEICSHMINSKKPNNYWTKEKVHEEALKYETKVMFREKSGSAHVTAKRMGWIKDVCSHMIEGSKPNGYWTKDRICEEALKYNTRTDFLRKSAGAYDAALNKNIIDEVCSHMTPQGNLEKRHIYVFEFENNHAYVGLTYNLKERHRSHLSTKNCVVYEHINNTNANYKFIKLTKSLVSAAKAQKLEEYYKIKYRDNGWIVLNIAKTGSLGGRKRRIWTKKRVREIALKCNTRIDFIMESSGAYNAAYRMGWLDEVCSHMVRSRKPNNYWTFEKCKEEALKYNKREHFKINCVSAYTKSRKMGWLDGICLHMTKRKPKKNIVIQVNVCTFGVPDSHNTIINKIDGI